MRSASGSVSCGRWWSRTITVFSGRFGGADGLYGGYTVVNGDNERICYALNQRLRDTVPIGKAFWNDGLCTHAKMAEQLDQNGGGGDSIGVVISHNDNRHALRYRTGPDTFCCLWDVLNSIGFYVGRREQFLFCHGRTSPEWLPRQNDRFPVFSIVAYSFPHFIPMLF